MGGQVGHSELVLGRAGQPHQHLELDRGEAVCLELRREAGGEPGVRLDEQADGGDAGVVEHLLGHPPIVAVLDTGNIAEAIVAVSVVVLLN